MKEVEGRDIEFVSTVEDLGIWLGIVGVEGKESGKKGRSIKEASCQKRMEVSKLLAALL